MSIEKILVEVEGYKDLDDPVIFTSGELGIYYINTEKLVQDGGKWSTYADDSLSMIRHAIQMLEEHPSYKKVVEVVANEINKLIPNNASREKYLISGGQRRDWIFSGPVAKELNLAHVSLHKDSSAYLIPADFSSIEALSYEESPLSGYTVIHVVDLLTVGSSAYNPKVEPPSGWIVYLRKLGANVENLFSIVNRNQGADDILASAGVNVHSFVSINKDFLKDNSKHPERALSYADNPRTWSEDFLKGCDISLFLENFDPLGSKIDRAKKFLKLYHPVLEESGKLTELCTLIKDKYEYDVLSD